MKNAQPDEAELPLAAELPLTVIYCAKCGLPPEYCSFGQKDVSACKSWLLAKHPDLFEEIYGVEEAEAGVSGADKAGENAEKEESKGAGDEEESKGGEQKPKKKGKSGKGSQNEGIIHVYKLRRGGKKVVCQITGFEHYTKDLKALASKFGKKFSCGANVAMDDIYGECVSVQGDVEDRLIEYLESDADMVKLAIPIEKIEFEDKGNKKGRKKH